MKGGDSQSIINFVGPTQPRDFFFFLGGGGGGLKGYILKKRLERSCIKKIRQLHMETVLDTKRVFLVLHKVA